MTELPIVVNFEDHFVLTMVTVDTALTMDGVAAAVAPHFIGPTLRTRPHSTMRIRLQGGESLPREMTVEDAGWVKFDIVEVFYE
ncbi:MAG: toluene monooxygenase [Gammaproteobacteria bacterium]|nr:toluene monooxygenase [Gammaproteobacteria bacterium]